MFRGSRVREIRVGKSVVSNYRRGVSPVFRLLDNEK